MILRTRSLTISCNTMAIEQSKTPMVVKSNLWCVNRRNTERYEISDSTIQDFRAGIILSSSLTLFCIPFFQFHMFCTTSLRY